MPLRIQLSRRSGWRMPPDTVKVDRSTRWGNPFVPGRENPFLPGRMVEDRRHAVRLYEGHAPLVATLVEAARRDLAGRKLACWCRLCDLHRSGKPLGEPCPTCDPCHVDTLGRLANGPICEELP